MYAFDLDVCVFVLYMYARAYPFDAGELGPERRDHGLARGGRQEEDVDLFWGFGLCEVMFYDTYFKKQNRSPSLSLSAIKQMYSFPRTQQAQRALESASSCPSKSSRVLPFSTTCRYVGMNVCMYNKSIN